MSAESQDWGYRTTPRDLRDERWLAERLEQSAREARRPLWTEEQR